MLPGMTAEFLSLIGFSISMSITPGPNNVMVAASAANHGIGPTMPHMLGIVVGFALMLTIVCAGLGSALLAWPVLLPLFRWGGAAWLTWLAWQIASAPPPGSGTARPVLGFVGAMGFQWVNPKAWLIGIGAAGEFMAPHAPLAPQVMRIFLVFLAVGLPCVLVWAVLGRGAGLLLTSPLRLRVFNVSMGVLLVVSLLPVLAEGW